MWVIISSRVIICFYSSSILYFIIWKFPKKQLSTNLFVHEKIQPPRISFISTSLTASSTNTRQQRVRIFMATNFVINHISNTKIGSSTSGCCFKTKILRRWKKILQDFIEQEQPIYNRFWEALQNIKISKTWVKTYKTSKYWNQNQNDAQKSLIFALAIHTRKKTSAFTYHDSKKEQNSGSIVFLRHKLDPVEILKIFQLWLKIHMSLVNMQY